MTKPVILLVEDNPTDVYLVTEAMHEVGLNFPLEVAADGEKAIDLIDKIDAGLASRPRFLLLDLNLPRRNGEEVLAKVRSSRLCSDLPVVILTSSDAPYDRELTDRLGATEYFRKPADLSEFPALGRLIQRVWDSAAALEPQV